MFSIIFKFNRWCESVFLIVFWIYKLVYFERPCLEVGGYKMLIYVYKISKIIFKSEHAPFVRKGPKNIIITQVEWNSIKRKFLIK